MSWTGCYDDGCQIHYGDKSGSNYWPRQPRQPTFNNQFLAAPSMQHRKPHLQMAPKYPGATIPRKTGTSGPGAYKRRKEGPCPTTMEKVQQGQVLGAPGRESKGRILAKGRWQKYPDVPSCEDTAGEGGERKNPARRERPSTTNRRVVETKGRGPKNDPRLGNHDGKNEDDDNDDSSRTAKGRPRVKEKEGGHRVPQAGVEEGWTKVVRPRKVKASWDRC
jgi:hypothetical protein